VRVRRELRLRLTTTLRTGASPSWLLKWDRSSLSVVAKLRFLTNTEAACKDHAAAPKQGALHTSHEVHARMSSGTGAPGFPPLSSFAPQLGPSLGLPVSPPWQRQWWPRGFQGQGPAGFAPLQPPQGLPLGALRPRRLQRVQSAQCAPSQLPSAPAQGAPQTPVGLQRQKRPLAPTRGTEGHGCRAQGEQGNARE